MPQYDESFILDDNANQRRNKRSYRVSRKGLLPAYNGASATLAGHGTYVLKNNINNLKKNRDFGSNYTLKENGFSDNMLYSKSANKSFPSLLDDPYKRYNDEKVIYSPETKDIYSIKNNNYYSFAAGKSLENLASHGHYSPFKNINGISFCHTRGKSLQNLNEKPHLPLLAKNHNRNASGYLSKSKSKDSIHNNGANCYIVNDIGADKRNKRIYETNAKLKEKAALRLAARILESGVYRQLGKTRCEENDDSGFVEDFDGPESAEVGAGGGPGGSGHKASFRSANKLARRARSFKEDLLERISAMRSAASPSSNSALPSLRSQSPLSPKGRGQSKNEDNVSIINPAKELETLVRQTQFDLRHFRDVIKKNKLEMLPGNGTIILDTITNIHAAIRPYVSPLTATPSEILKSALDRLCQAAADLIRLCDENMVAGEGCAGLNTENCFRIIDEVQKAVEDLSIKAGEKLTENGNAPHEKTNGFFTEEPKNINSQSRPGVDNIRNPNNDGQRNSLPDIPLTPRDLQMLETAGNGLTVRSSHSTESILDSTKPHQEPPPKPPIPMRHYAIAPPLPPKRKPCDNASLLSAMDRVSLQSRSSGSLDSVLNVSNDEEIRTIMDRNSTNLDDSLQNATLDSIGSSNPPSFRSNRLSSDSNSTVDTTSSTTTQQNRFSNEIPLQETSQTDIFSNDTLGNHNVDQNRFSSESGFSSMGNIRNCELNNSSFCNVIQAQNQNLSYIDSTPTPIDMPDFCNEKSMKTMNFDSQNLIVKQMSTSSNFFKQSSKTIVSNESKHFNHSFSNNTVNQMSFDFQKSVAMKSEVVESFVRNVTQTSISDSSNLISSSSNTSNLSSFASSQFGSVKTDENGLIVYDVITDDRPPALPAKTRKHSKALSPKVLLENEKLLGMSSSLDNDNVELRANSAGLHGQKDGLIPAELIDQSVASGLPPPLPMKKKHMFQSVAYSVMAYMEMFGNCSHSPQNPTDFLRHSLHEQHTANHCMSSLQQLSNTSIEANMSDQTVFAKNGQTVIGFNQNTQMFTGTKCTQQLTQSHTLHQFNISSTGSTSQQNLSAFSSPLRSPHLSREDSIKSDALSISSSSTNSSIPQVSSSIYAMPNNNIYCALPLLPPELPPKKTKIKHTPNHSPAKAAVNPKPPASGQTKTSSPSTPASLTCVTPPSGQLSISPAPRFQFDPPANTIDSSLLLNPDEDHWHNTSPNKPGKFPVEDLDLGQKTSVSPSPERRDPEPVIENENNGEPDVILEMDVSHRLVWKSSNEDGPDIRGGHPDALIVHAIKSTKDFSEAFLTTYRTFVTPLNLLEKLKKRHLHLVKHGQHSKAREVQSMLTRVVVDLTVADLDDKLLSLILDFIYGLVCSGDLKMAKTLRVIVIDKFKNKKMMLQHQESLAETCLWNSGVTSRRDTLLDIKPEAIAEQMTFLDAELFARISVPEALIWTRYQREEQSPNLTRFTEHFNNMSYWARCRILEQEEAKDREKYVMKFLKVMKHLRKMNNFNSYLALLSALSSAPIHRLDWSKPILDGISENSTLMESSSSFRAYRQALAEAHPPCIPYLGQVLQDLTFIHAGNPDHLPDGSINFQKRWQQYHTLEDMKRFSKVQYSFKKNDRVIAAFNGFEDFLDEEALWQRSESIKPKGGKKTNAN